MGRLLSVDGLSVAFRGDGGDSTYVDGVAFHVDAGETVCIVGESGCGKSVTVLSLMGLLGENGRVTAGTAFFDGQDLLALPPAQLDHVRGNTLTMIFQDAMSSLNPVLTVGRQLTEAILAHQPQPRAQAQARAVQLLARVGLPEPERVMRNHPHTLSGGMRQRVMIAMALCCGPKLLIADEPTTALDVTIQAQIMRLLMELKTEYGMALLLITHDMGLVAEMADRVLVMYAGQVVEEADVATLFARPRHPYTRALLRSVPSLQGGAARRLDAIRGVVPEQYEQLPGCRFFGRCELAVPRCEVLPQDMQALSGGTRARCWRAWMDGTPLMTPEGGDAVAAWLETRRGQNDPLVEPAPDNPVAAWLKTRSGQGATVVEAAPHSPAAQGSTQGGAATDGAAYGHAAPETATSGGITDKTYPARSGEAPAAHGEPPRSVPPTGASDSETPANTAEGGGAHTKPQPEGRRGQ